MVQKLDIERGVEGVVGIRKWRWWLWGLCALAREGFLPGTQVPSADKKRLYLSVVFAWNLCEMSKSFADMAEDIDDQGRLILKG